MACEICQKRAKEKVIEKDGKKARRCDGCGEPIANHLGMGGNGFEDPVAEHIHPHAPNSPVHKELCADCFKASYAKAFPGHEGEVPPVIPS